MVAEQGVWVRELCKVSSSLGSLIATGFILSIVSIVGHSFLRRAKETTQNDKKPVCLVYVENNWMCKNFSLAPAVF